MDQARQQAITAIAASEIPLGPPTTLEYAKYLSSLAYACAEGEWPSQSALAAYLTTHRFSRCFWDAAMTERMGAHVTR